MSWLKKLFGVFEKPKTLLDEVQEVGGKLIVTGYRRLAAQQGCAPTTKTSDRQIVEIYKKVSTAFREAADQRGEQLPVGILNFIVWKFLQVNEMFGGEMLGPHLTHEVQKYLQEGLRADYRQNLKLFEKQMESEHRETIATCEGFDDSPDEKKEREELYQKMKKASVSEKTTQALIDAVFNGTRGKL